MTGIRGFLRNMMSKPSAYRLKALGWSRQNFDVTKLKPNDLIHIGWFPTFCGGLKLDPTKELYDLFEAALKDYRKLLDLARAGNKGDDNLAIAMDIMFRRKPRMPVIAPGPPMAHFLTFSTFSCSQPFSGL